MVGYSPWGRKESDTTEKLHFLSFLYTLSFADCSLSSLDFFLKLDPSLGIFVLVVFSAFLNNLNVIFPEWYFVNTFSSSCYSSIFTFTILWVFACWHLEWFYWDFPGGPVARTPCSQCRGPRSHPWWDPTCPIKKDPACCSENWRSCVLQLRPGAAKKKKNGFMCFMTYCSVCLHQDISWEYTLQLSLLVLNSHASVVPGTQRTQ